MRAAGGEEEDDRSGPPGSTGAKPRKHDKKGNGKRDRPSFAADWLPTVDLYGELVKANEVDGAPGPDAYHLIDEEIERLRSEANQDIRCRLKRFRTERVPRTEPLRTDDFISMGGVKDEEIDTSIVTVLDEDPPIPPGGSRKRRRPPLEPPSPRSDDLPPPWLPTRSRHSRRLGSLGFFDRFHEEIVYLVKWLNPTPLERMARQQAIARITNAVAGVWSDCVVQPFGSYYTGMWLPNGDLDICLMNLPQGREKRHLEILALELSRYNIARGLEVIRHARVPIVKYVDAKTGIPVDVSINQSSALDTSNFVRQQLLRFKMLRPLILLTKLYLQQKGLNETYKGGLGSYLVFVLCLSFLQLHPSSSNPTLHKCVNLGILFFEFLQYYGKTRPFTESAISVNYGGCLFPKYEKDFSYPDKAHLMAVESPLDPDCDIGRNSWNIKEIRGCFAQSFGDLVERLNLFQKGLFVDKSILASVIHNNDPLMRLRVSSWKCPEGSDDEPDGGPVGGVLDIPEMPEVVMEAVAKEMAAGTVNQRKSKKSRDSGDPWKNLSGKSRKKIRT